MEIEKESVQRITTLSLPPPKMLYLPYNMFVPEYIKCKYVYLVCLWVFNKGIVLVRTSYIGGKPLLVLALRMYSIHIPQNVLIYMFSVVLGYNGISSIIFLKTPDLECFFKGTWC